MNNIFRILQLFTFFANLENQIVSQKGINQTNMKKPNGKIINSIKKELIKQILYFRKKKNSK